MTDEARSIKDQPFQPSAGQFWWTILVPEFFQWICRGSSTSPFIQSCFLCSPPREIDDKHALINLLSITFHLRVGILVHPNSWLMQAGLRWDFRAGLLTAQLVIRIQPHLWWEVHIQPWHNIAFICLIFTRRELGCCTSRKKWVSWGNTPNTGNQGENGDHKRNESLWLLLNST